ncbi:MAG: GDSL-type esterase/lipase family protein [Labilibaculum antarcticum]
MSKIEVKYLFESKMKHVLLILIFGLLRFSVYSQELKCSDKAVKGDVIKEDGTIRYLDSSMFRIFRRHTKNAKEETILLVPGSDFSAVNTKQEGIKVARFLNEKGYDVVVLDYHTGTESNIQNLAENDVLNAYQYLKNSFENLGLSSSPKVFIGFSSGATLAAKAVERLNKGEQPEKIILISPINMDECMIGTVYPTIMPPANTESDLFLSVNETDQVENKTRCIDFYKTWIGYDGQAVLKVIKDSICLAGENINPIAEEFQLRHFILHSLETSKILVETDANPATKPAEGYNKGRLDEKLKLIANNKYDLILMGNSIINNFEKTQYQEVWNQFFAPRNAINLGFSGYRTENVLWNIQKGILSGQAPKAIILEVGTNNVDEKHYPTRHTASQVAGGIEAIVKEIRSRLPETKIVLLRPFPGSYDGPNPTSHRAILNRLADLISKLSDQKHVFYCDVNHLFLNLDGSIKHEMMSDWLHPTPQGAKLWAQSMEPLLSQLMNDKVLDTEINSNTAVVPVSKLEQDSYNWWDRHNDVLAIKDSINPEIVLIGNSITHFWGGKPDLKYVDGRARKPNGPISWNNLFSKYRVLNLGFGWDRTQNVLWRLDHGELDGLHPRNVIIHIGTNNTSQTSNARINTADEIVAGIAAVYSRVRSKVPGAKIILMSVFPREEKPDHPRRQLINKINIKLEQFAHKNNIKLVDIGMELLTADGILTREMAQDYCHPTEKGYQIWADTIKSIIEKE